MQGIPFRVRSQSLASLIERADRLAVGSDEYNFVVHQIHSLARKEHITHKLSRSQYNFLRSRYVVNMKEKNESYHVI